MLDQPSIPRELATVQEIADKYRVPRSTIYEILRREPQAGVVNLGRRVLVDADQFDRHARQKQIEAAAKTASETT